MSEYLRIGEAAELSGLASSAIRFYEEAGVLPAAQRTSTGYRGYSENDVDLLRFVARLRALEFPLSDVREIVALRREGRAPCARVRETISREAAAIKQRIVDLGRLEHDLGKLEEETRGMPDDWPTACVCIVLEGSLTVGDR